MNKPDALKLWESIVAELKHDVNNLEINLSNPKHTRNKVSLRMVPNFQRKRTSKKRWISVKKLEK